MRIEFVTSQELALQLFSEAAQDKVILIVANGNLVKVVHKVAERHEEPPIWLRVHHIVLLPQLLSPNRVIITPPPIPLILVTPRIPHLEDLLLQNHMAVDDGIRMTSYDPVLIPLLSLPLTSTDKRI